jgi:hypothetical protein
MRRAVRCVISLIAVTVGIVLLSNAVLNSFGHIQYAADHQNTIIPISSQPDAGYYHRPVSAKILKEYNISLELLLERQDKRQRLLSTVCSNISRGADDVIRMSDLRWLYVDDTHKTLYCAVPKVATTNWKRVLLMLTGKMNVTTLDELSGTDVHGHLQRRHLIRLNSLSRDEIQFRLRTYFKFVFVRDPFERLVSAYKSKFMTGRNTYFQQRDGRRIIRRYRPNALNESLSRGHDVSFNEFVQYVIDPRSSLRRPLNEHWRPYYQLCRPCQIRYDVIGKYETLEEDAVHVIAAIAAAAGSGAGDVTVRFPVVRRTNRTSDRHLRLSSVTHDDVQRLCTVYSADCQLFGYSCPSLPPLSLPVPS